MHGMGFKEVIGLKGGMMEWRAAKLPEEGVTLSGDQGLTKDQFDLFLNSEKLVLVDFYADWCQPCQKMKPYLEEISNEMKDRVVVIRINADDNRSLCQNLGVSSLPVLQLYRSKKMVWSHNGYISKEEVIVQLNKN
jgi:thioredoxin 1